MKKVILFLQLLPLYSFAQNFSPSSVFAQCPGSFEVYSINIGSQTAGCSYNWEVVNGEILGGSLSGNVSTIYNQGTSVSIKWSTTSNNGSIKITTTSCSSPSNNGIPKSNSYAIKSLNGVTPSAVTGDDNISPNIISNKSYSVNQVNYPTRGSSDLNPFPAEYYEWEIPSGWTTISGGNTRTIVVQPNNYSGGTIRVRAKSACGSYYSNWSPAKNITRNLDTPGSISGVDKVMCSNNSTKNYSVSPVTGAESYIWTLPSGWSGSSSSNSITVTPNGLNGGNISVRAVAGSIQSASSTKNISVLLYDEGNPPHVSGNDLVCSSGYYTLNNQPGSSSLSWSSTNTSHISINSSTGVATYTGNGGTYITATVTTACGNFQKNKFVWSGNPDLTKKIDGVIAGTTPVSPGNLYNLTAQSQSPSTSFNYNNYYGTGDMTIDLYTPNSPNTQMYVYGTTTNGSRHVRVTATNSCGSYYQDFVFYIPSFFKAVYPNPAKDYLTLEFNDLSNKTGLPDAIELINGKSIQKELTLSIDNLLKDIKNINGNKYHLNIRHLDRGIWYLHAVKKGQGTEVIRLLFE